MRRIATTLLSLGVGVLLTAAGLIWAAHTLLMAGFALLAVAVLFWVIDWRSRADRRIYLETPLTEEFVAGLFAGRTEIQADKLAELYTGKWVKVSGTVTDIRTGVSGGLNINLMDESPSLFLHFSRWHRRRLETLHKGDAIQAHGRIQTVSKNWISLNSCELSTANDGVGDAVA